MTGATVAVCTVTHNSAQDLEGWWKALVRLHDNLLHAAPECQDHAADLRVIAVDCASTDDSLSKLRRLAGADHGPHLTVISSQANVGFAGGMNLAAGALSRHDRWLLSLNPDARPEPASLPRMIAAFTQHRPVGASASLQWKVGSVTGRLVRPAEGSTDDSRQRLLDACGMAWSRSWRHLDRGSNEPDDGRYGQAEEVFAGTGACTLYWVKALRDVELPARLAPATTNDQPQFFHQDFHSFREDAELGFRLQRRGWACVYAADALVEHRRFNLPERRSQMSAFVNYHSLKNRYLLRLLHQSGSNCIRTMPAVLRDVLILGFVVLRERSSLAAYSWLFKNRRRLLKQRQWLTTQQTVADHRINGWFSRSSLALKDRNTPDALDQ